MQPDQSDQPDSKSTSSGIGNPIRNVVLIGILTLLTITAVSILHANEYEFVILRFPGLTSLEVSYFDTVLYIAYLIVGILVGIFSDRIGQRRIFIVVGSLGAVGLYWAMTLITDYGLLLLTRFLQGSCTVLSWQTLMTLILDWSTGGNRGKNMGVFGIFLALAMGMGPSVGGVLARQGVFFPYYLAAVLSAVVGIIAIIALREPPELKEKPSLRETLMVGVKRPELSIPGLFNFVDRFHMSFILFIIPLYLQAILNLGPELRGMALGIYALPFIILQYPVGKFADKHGRYRLLILGSIGFGVVLGVMGAIGAFGFPVFLAVLFVLGIFSGLTQPPAMALVGDYVDASEHAMGMGVFNFVGNIGITLGAVVGGYLLTISDFVFAFIVAGVIELIALGINIGLIAWKQRTSNKTQE